MDKGYPDHYWAVVEEQPPLHIKVPMHRDNVVHILTMPDGEMLYFVGQYLDGTGIRFRYKRGGWELVSSSWVKSRHEDPYFANEPRKEESHVA